MSAKKHIFAIKEIPQCFFLFWIKLITFKREQAIEIATLNLSESNIFPLRSLHAAMFVNTRRNHRLKVRPGDIFG